MCSELFGPFAMWGTVENSLALDIQ